MPARLPLRLIATLAPLGLACSAFTSEGPCTLIGCSDGLVVRVDGAGDGPTTIELRVPLRPPVVRTCGGPAHCAAGVQFENETPEHVTIVVTSGDREQVMDAEPAYVTSRPNGPDCEPECRQAVVTVALPPA
jgi:hypothetical protein